MRIQQKAASYENIRKWITDLIGQANGGKVCIYQLTLMWALLRADFNLHVEYCVT